MKKCLISIALIAISVSACTSNINSTKGTNIKPNAEMLQIKDIEGYGMETDYSGKNIGLAEPVIAAFNSIGPSNRIKTITAIQAPIMRLRGATATPLDKETNDLIGNAIKINADSSMIDSSVWSEIRNKYPSLTHIATTIFQISEEWKDSSEGHYLWSSYIVARTIVIDINTRQIISEWRQEVQDRSTWERAPESPERLAFYLKPIESTQRKTP